MFIKPIAMGETSVCVHGGNCWSIIIIMTCSGFIATEVSNLSALIKSYNTVIPWLMN